MNTSSLFHKPALNMNNTIIRIVTMKAAIEDKTLQKHQKFYHLLRRGFQSRGLNIDLFHNAGLSIYS